MATSREFEIVLLGATGFTGRLVAEQLARPDPSDPRPLRWAIAGRSAGKLAEVAAALATISPGAPAPAQLVVDVTDGAALAALAARTSVVCSTVGPYAQHGSGVVAACVAAGTHYCDLTGEVALGAADPPRSATRRPRRAAPASSTAAGSTPSRPTWGCGTCSAA